MTTRRPGTLARNLTRVQRACLAGSARVDSGCPGSLPTVRLSQRPVNRIGTRTRGTRASTSPRKAQVTSAVVRALNGMPEVSPSETDHGWGSFLVSLPDTDNLKCCRWVPAPGGTTAWEQAGRFMAIRGAMGIEAVTARRKTTAARRAGRLGQHDRGSGLARQNPVAHGGPEDGTLGTPSGRPGSPAGSGRSIRPASPTLNTGLGSGTTGMIGIRRSWLSSG